MKVEHKTNYQIYTTQPAKGSSNNSARRLISNNKPVSEDQPFDPNPKTIANISMDDSANIGWIFKDMQRLRKYIEDDDELKRLNKEKYLKFLEQDNAIDETLFENG